METVSFGCEIQLRLVFYIALYAFATNNNIEN